MFFLLLSSFLPSALPLPCSPSLSLCLPLPHSLPHSSFLSLSLPSSPFFSLSFTVPPALPPPLPHSSSPFLPLSLTLPPSHRAHVKSYPPVKQIFSLSTTLLTLSKSLPSL